METYSLWDAAHALNVDLGTLRRWRRAAGGVGSRGIADGRRVWISYGELLALARKHKRVLIDTAAKHQYRELLQYVELLFAQVEDLKQQVAHAALLAGQV